VKLAIMQPYMFPYIGYFQLINAVDTFVFFDDVNFISKGWINRNNILLNGTRHLITLELRGPSIFKHINQIEIGKNRHKILSTIYHAYAKAPYFKKVIPILEDCLNQEDQNLAKFVIYTIKSIASLLNLKTSFVLSSDLNKDNSLKGQIKIIRICNLLFASQYFNPIGGIELYSRDIFEKENITLSFLRSRNIGYKQFNNEFVPNLSIIDMLMFCPVEAIQVFLKEYDLE
jgi:WbqC-like protein family